jgi:hypothetical protein
MRYCVVIIMPEQGAAGKSIGEKHKEGLNFEISGERKFFPACPTPENIDPKFTITLFSFGAPRCYQGARRFGVARSIEYVAISGVHFLLRKTQVSKNKTVARDNFPNLDRHIRAG